MYNFFILSNQPPPKTWLYKFENRITTLYFHSSEWRKLSYL